MRYYREYLPPPPPVCSNPARHPGPLNIVLLLLLLLLHSTFLCWYALSSHPDSSCNPWAMDDVYSARGKTVGVVISMCLLLATVSLCTWRGERVRATACEVDELCFIGIGVELYVVVICVGGAGGGGVWGEHLYPRTVPEKVRRGVKNVPWMHCVKMLIRIDFVYINPIFGFYPKTRFPTQK